MFMRLGSQLYDFPVIRKVLHYFFTLTRGKRNGHIETKASLNYIYTFTSQIAEKIFPDFKGHSLNAL